MSLNDLNNFCIGIPCYKFTPTFQLFQCLCLIPPERHIFSFCSDIRFSRNSLVSTFFTDKFLSSDVLVFCDLDTVPNPQQINAIVTNCSKETPFIGTNVPYRQDARMKNYFLFNDPKGEKREILNKEHPEAIISVEYAGFGLVAVHRSLLEKMILKYGHVSNGGSKSPNLFGELREFSEERKEKLLTEDLIKINFLEQAKLKGVEEETFNKTWDLYKDHIIQSVQLNNKDYILPETFSFCKRAREVGAELLVMTGVKPGHYSEQALFSI